jgi:SAM-dependent methyltransferase
MGCGSGTLAIPFAQKGHEVFAADFSPEMLKYLKQGAEEAGVADRIHAIELNWNEDWNLRDLPKCDIAFSSRSFITRDLTSSLQKLESVAKRKVCIGAWDTPVSGYERHIAKIIGYERPGIGTHYMIMGELMDRDVFPELKYIYTPFRLTKYESREAAEEQLRAAFSHMTPEQEELFSRYLEDHLIYHSEAGTHHGKDLDGFWQFDHNDNSSIAFISWNIKSVYE